MYKKNNNKKKFQCNYNKERLMSYALWYIKEFDTISSKKIFEKLNEKTKNEEYAKEVFNFLIENWYLNDKNAIKKLVERYLFKFKDKNYIINSLLQKQFKKEDILEILEEKYKNNRYLYFNQEFTTERLIEKIKNLLKRKSLNEIIDKLSSNNEERNYIKNLIEENKGLIWIDDELDVLYDKIQNYIEKKKLNINNYTDKQKIIKYFVWKRYNLKDIQQIIKEIIEEENY